MQIPEHKPMSMWLFSDNVQPTAYKFLGYDEKYKTQGGKTLPVFLFYGAVQTKKGIVQCEVVTSIWNIENLNEMRTKLGADDTVWLKTFFFIKPKGTQLTLEVAA